MELNFNIETETKVRDRLEAGYRARRNFLVSELLSLIVYQTPVKDGYARGGWDISIGSATFDSGLPPDKSGGGTILRAIGKLRGAGAFKDIFIGNEVEYIEQLEDGYSKQAPSGMVKVSLSAFKSMYGDVS